MTIPKLEQAAKARRRGAVAAAADEQRSRRGTKPTERIFISGDKLYALAAAALVMPIVFQCAAGADAKMPTAKIGDNLIKLEVAASTQEIERGLMYRTSLPEDQGMVFLFHPTQKVNFWMYHTLIPLDMLFIKNGKIEKIFHDVPPCKSENQADCPVYPGGTGLEVSEVVEVNGGYAQRHNLKEGEKIQIDLH